MNTILSKDHVMRIKYSILKATIMPIRISDSDTIESLSYLNDVEKYDEAYQVIEEYLCKELKYPKVIFKRYPQVVRDAIFTRTVKVGIELDSKSDMNRIKIANPSLSQVIFDTYDIRV